MQEMSFAVAVTTVNGQWQVQPFADSFDDPSTSLRAVRGLRSEAAAFALLCVEDEYFVIVRPGPNGEQVLLSDATMAVDDDFAREFAELAGIEIPDISPDELDDIDGWPDGDFDILANIGLSEELLGVIADNTEAWPHEQLELIAEELGFSEELREAVDY